MNGVLELRNYEFNNKKYKELNIYERDLYEFLYTYVNVNKRIFTVYPSIETIKTRINLSAPTIIKYIKSLAKKGWLAVSKQKCKMGHYNEYTLKVLWNNTKKSFFEAGEKLKNAGSAIVNKINNIIKKEETFEESTANVEVDSLEQLETSMFDFKEFEDIKSDVQKVEIVDEFEEIEDFEEVKTDEEIAEEEFNRKERLVAIKRVVNPLQKLTDNFIRLTEKADIEDVFWEAIIPVIDKVVEEDQRVSIRYLENALKIALNNKKYYKDLDTKNNFKNK